MTRKRVRQGRRGRRTARGSGRRGVAALPLLALLLIAAGGAAPATAEVMGVAGVGAFAVRSDEDSSALIDLEVRLPPRRRGIMPVLGAAATSEGATYLRAGIGRDYPHGRGWTTHLGLTGNLYFEGPAGKRLGGALEFRTVVDLSYQVAPDLRVGLALAHLSNGGLGRFNPGVETLSLTFAWRHPPGLRRTGR